MVAGFVDYVLPFLVILTVLVFVHEMGHYLVARRAGVRVEVFSIGFGRELFGWTARSGTRWKFSAIPLGGYVKMFGDADPASTGAVGLDGMSPEERSVSFHHKSLKARAAIVAAGPIANFLFAIVLLAGLYAIVGRPYAPPVVDEVVAGSAAEQAGIRVGDVFVTANGEAVTRFSDLRRLVFNRPGEPVPMTIERDGGRVAITVIPETVTEVDRFGARHLRAPGREIEPGQHRAAQPAFGNRRGRQRNLGDRWPDPGRGRPDHRWNPGDRGTRRAAQDRPNVR